MGFNIEVFVFEDGVRVAPCPRDDGSVLLDFVGNVLPTAERLREIIHVAWDIERLHPRRAILRPATGTPTFAVDSTGLGYSKRGRRVFVHRQDGGDFGAGLELDWPFQVPDANPITRERVRIIEGL